MANCSFLWIARSLALISSPGFSTAFWAHLTHHAPLTRESMPKSHGPCSCQRAACLSDPEWFVQDNQFLSFSSPFIKGDLPNEILAGTTNLIIMEESPYLGLAIILQVATKSRSHVSSSASRGYFFSHFLHHEAQDFHLLSCCLRRLAWGIL